MGSQVIKSFKETGEHSYHRRAMQHDYFAPFIYHIIIKKAKLSHNFGVIEGDARFAPGNQGSAKIRESKVGSIIAKAILHWPYQFPIIKVYQFCVMPDHVHVLLQILYRSDKHLDFYVDALKNRIAGKYSKEMGMEITEDQIFENGYCDKPLFEKRSLDELYVYIQENPHRLAMRKQYPQFFQRVRKLKIGQNDFEAYGNLFLLRNPDKLPVKISRSFSDKELDIRKEQWKSGAVRGSILVSPFISQGEKEIRTEAESLGAKIILITHQAFPERFKPASHDFALCSEGRLLIISMGLPPGTPLSRSLCLEMNNLAEYIVSTTLSAH